MKAGDKVKLIPKTLAGGEYYQLIDDGYREVLFGTVGDVWVKDNGWISLLVIDFPEEEGAEFSPWEGPDSGLWYDSGTGNREDLYQIEVVNSD